MEWHLRERQAWEVSQAGWLVVAGEPAWLTREGDEDDHVLSRGGVLPVRAGERIHLGPWAEGSRPRVVFVPDQPARRRPEPAWRRGFGSAAAWARSALARASRAHGAI